mgnify:CR=1 FL=1|jgi:orotate phosphoribosyltransferase
MLIKPTKPYLSLFKKNSMNRIIEILKEVNAVMLDDHFVGTSGRHLEGYIAKDTLYPHTELTSEVGELFAKAHKDLEIDIVAAPAMGGIILSQWTAHHLSKIKHKQILSVYAEKKDGELTFTRGYGKLLQNKKVLIVEDLTTTGGSLKTVVDLVKKAGGIAVACSVMVNRDSKNVTSNTFGIPFTPLAELSIKSFAPDSCPLCKSNMPINTTVGHGKQFLESQKQIPSWNNSPSKWLDETNKAKQNTAFMETPSAVHIAPKNADTYSSRAKLCNNPTAKRLLQIMDQKQTNLAIAADVTTKEELLHIASSCGPEICMLKTHIDIVEDFDQDLVVTLQRLADRHNFLIFEDRKFADIGNTVKLQYEKGIYKIANWSHMVNAHSVAGPGIILGLKEVGAPRGRGLVMLAEMSPKGNLATGEYTTKTLEMAKEHKDFVIGFITMKKLLEDPCFINMTPGVKLAVGGDSLGQQYNTPEKVIYNQGSDVIIVGRGIYQAGDMIAAAKEYRKAGWDAYEKRLNA